MKSEELKATVINVLSSIEGIRTLDVLTSYVSPCSKGDVAIALVELCQEGRLEISAEGFTPLVAGAALNEVLLGAPAAPEEELLGVLSPVADEKVEKGSVLAAESAQGADVGVAVTDEATGSCSLAPLFLDDSFDCLELPTRACNRFTEKRVADVRGAVALLDGLDGEPGLGAGTIGKTRACFLEAARPLSYALSKQQLQALRGIANCQGLSFDSLGLLVALPELAANERNPLVSLDIAALGLNEPVERRLRVHGIETIDRINKLKREGLARIPGMGGGAVSSVIKSLIDYCERVGENPPAWCAAAVEPFDEQSFLGEFDESAVRVVNEMQRRLIADGYNPFHPALVVLLTPKAQRMLRAGSFDKEVITSLVNELESSSVAALCRARQLARDVDDVLESFGTMGGVAVPSGSDWTEAALLAAQNSGGRFEFDADSRKLLPHVCSLDEWLDTIDARHADALRMRLDGATLQEVGDKLSITRERVRQMCESALADRVLLEGDVYQSFVDRYAMTPDQFARITGLSERDYRYLAAVSKTRVADRLPLLDALHDQGLSEHVRDAVASLRAVGNELLIGSQRIKLDKESIVDYLLAEHLQECPMDERRLYDLYCSFIAEHDLGSVRRLDPTTARAFGACVDRYDGVMDAHVPSDGDGARRGVRPYHSSQYDFAPLRAAVASLVHLDIECSTVFLMKQPSIAKLLAAFDIRNEYELHYVLTHWCEPIEGVEYSRVPMLTLGSADRDAQIVGVIRDIGPADAVAVSEEYERRYGVKETTFRGSFLNGFERWCHDGLYIVDTVELDDDERSSLGAILGRVGTGGRARDIESSFLGAYPQRSNFVLTDALLAPYGLHLCGGTVIDKSIDAHDYFAQLISEHEYFCLEFGEFTNEVINDRDFISELHKAERAFSVLEIGPREYLNIAVFESAPHPVGAQMMRAILDAVIDCMEPGRPYSVANLKEFGFFDALNDTLLDLGLDDYVCQAIMMQGYVGGRIKRTSIGDAMLFCKMSGSFSTAGLLNSLVHQRGAMSVSQMAELLYELYGVSIKKPVIRTQVKQVSVRLDREQDMLYPE